MTQGFTQNLPIPLPINKGGTGSVTAASALTSLGLTATAANLNLLTSASQTVVQHVYSESGAVATGTTLIPYDNTIPQNTEGDQYFTLSITPLSATNILKIEFHGWGANSVANNFTVALFQDTTANALAASCTNTQTVNATQPLVMVHRMVAGTTSATTFKIRIGGSTAGTFTLNGSSGGRIFGGVAASSLSIIELTP